MIEDAIEYSHTVFKSQSPEIVESKPYSYKSDLWSLGCILFEMMSLKHAFDANDMNGLIMKIIRGKIPPLPNKYSPELKQLTTALLSKIPSRRPSLESILKMKFLQTTVKGVQSIIVNYNQEHLNRQANGYMHGQMNGHVKVDKAIPDMRKQLQIQMKKQNVPPRPKSGERKALIDPRKVRAKQGVQVPQQKIPQPKRVARQEPSLDIAVDIAEQRLKDIHKEFRAVRVQAKLLEDAVNIHEDDADNINMKLKQKDMNRNNQYAKPSNQNRKVVQNKIPEPRRRSAGSELQHHRPEPRRRSAGSELQEHRPEPRRRSAGSELQQNRPEPRRRSAGESNHGAYHKESEVSNSNSGNAKERAKDAKMQRKIEENRKYEEQLKQARKSYFEEKKAAMQKKQDLYKESSPPSHSEAQSRYEDQMYNASPVDYEEDDRMLHAIQEVNNDAIEANRRYEEQLELARMSYYEEKKAALQKKQDLYRESSPPSHSEAQSRYEEQMYHASPVDYEEDDRRLRGIHEEEESQFIVQEKMIYSGEAEVDNHIGHQNANSGFEVEESLVYNSIPEDNEAGVGIDTGVLAQGGIVDKVNAIRDYCLEKLGSSLFHELCGLIKLHNSRALTSTSDVEYAGEILERLGEPRIHFAGLIDHLLYLEEQLY